MLWGQGRSRSAPSAVKSAHSPLPQPRAGWQELRGALDTKQELMSEEIKHLEKQKALPALPRVAPLVCAECVRPRRILEGRGAIPL